MQICRASWAFACILACAVTTTLTPWQGKITLNKTNQNGTHKKWRRRRKMKAEKEEEKSHIIMTKKFFSFQHSSNDDGRSSRIMRKEERKKEKNYAQRSLYFNAWFVSVCWGGCCCLAFCTLIHVRKYLFMLECSRNRSLVLLFGHWFN